MNGMQLYNDVSNDLAKNLTLRYSTSFGLASKLFAASIRPHVYAIYGMVRIADEIVDTYAGPDTSELLSAFQNEVHAGVNNGYSTNPIVQAFANTARKFGFGAELIDPFFDSMRMDISMTSFTPEEYERYIYGSAEVVGLMCLKVFTAGDKSQYTSLKPGAQMLGSTYQKVNFLRDFGADFQERGRVYFPGINYAAWNDEQKAAIIAELEGEFMTAYKAITKLPRTARTSVYLSYRYYEALLRQLKAMTAEQIKTSRAHVSTLTKLGLFMTAPIGARLQ